MIRYVVVCTTCGYARLTLSDVLADNIRDAHVLNGHAARVVARRPHRPELLKPLKEVKPIRELVIAALQSTLKKENR
jgi:hypothetical protein